MLHRKDPEGLIVISQPAHSWISGQLARVWGGGEFEQPSEDLCLAAELHDVGFLDWERSPTFNPETGLPHDFLNMPPDLHLSIWSKGIEHLLRFGSYPALLLSMQFCNIAHQNWVSRKKGNIVRQFLADQISFQQTTLAALKNDSHYAAFLTDSTILRDRQLLTVLDWLSLLLCLGLQEPKTIPEVPSRNATTPITVTPLDAHGKTVRLSPWPLRVPNLQVAYEGRRFLKTCKSETEMREAFQAAPRLTLLTEVRA